METYRMSSCYSGTPEDVINIGIKIATTAIHNKDYSFGLKFIKDAITKNEENPSHTQEMSQLLNTLIALIYLGMGKYEKVCFHLWENPVSNPNDFNHLAS